MSGVFEEWRSFEINQVTRLMVRTVQREHNSMVRHGKDLRLSFYVARAKVEYVWEEISRILINAMELSQL